MLEWCISCMQQLGVHIFYPFTTVCAHTWVTSPVLMQSNYYILVSMLALCKRCKNSVSAHMKDNTTEESNITLEIFILLKSHNSVCECVLPSSIRVGDSCLDIVNIMAKLTAQDDGLELFTYTHPFFKINLWHITWWHTSWLRTFSEQERNFFSNEIFHMVQCGMTPWVRQSGMWCCQWSLWGQPSLLKEQSRNPFDMNLIHRADWNLIRTTGVHGVFAVVKKSTLTQVLSISTTLK